LLSNAELVERLTKNAAELVSKNHSPDEYARSLIRIYDAVVSARETQA